MRNSQTDESQRSGAVRALIIDDSVDDAVLIVRALQASGFVLFTRRVASRQELVEALQDSGWDLVFCDYNLPGFSMEEAFEQLARCVNGVPFIVVTGTIGEEKAVDLIRMGINDVVLKGNMSVRLGLAARRELASAKIRKSVRLSESALHAAQRQLLDITANIPGLVYRRVMQPDGTVVYPFVGGSFLEAFGISGDLARSGSFDPRTITHRKDLALLARRIKRSAADLSPLIHEWRLSLPSGETRWLASRSQPRREANGSIVWDSVAIDVTERLQARERLQLLHQLSLAIAEAEDFKCALSDVLRLTSVAIGWPFSEALALDESTEKLVQIACWHIDDPIWTGFAERRRGLSHGIGTGMSGRVWRTQKPFWMNNVEGSRSLRAIARASVKKAGVKTAFAVPIKKGKKMLAVLAFCARDVRPKDSRLIETISAVAAQLSIALERKLGEQELKKSEARLELAQEVAGIGSWEIDHGTGRRYWSKQTYRICGVAIDESPVTVTNRRDLVLPEDWHKWDAWHDAVISAHQPPSVEYRIVRPDGEIRVVSVEGKLIHDEARGSFRTVGTLQDITEARLVSRQLAQAQKMEALGTLTSGLAHDFNNILSVIMPNLEFLRDHAQDHPMAVESMADALDAAKRGAELIRGLLGIARHSALEHEPVDVNRLVGETVKLLSRLLGKNIDILVNLSDDIGIVSTDPTQLKMAIANLATNARDAMPNGGRLTITTRTRHITANDVPEDPDVRAGDYCVIQVSDSGTGMSAETLKGIFDPFFTTKPEGKGTGLGLSMVFRLMKLSKGTIRAISRPGEGTTFDLLFPRVSEAPLSAIDKSSIDRISGGSEHVLIVDDDPKVLALAARILRNLGYTVWEAGAFGPALNLLNNGSPVDLLLSDAVNSGAGENLGLVREALRLRPGLKVLRTSGNPREEEAPGERLPFLAKPYTTAALAQAVRAALDAA